MERQFDQKMPMVKDYFTWMDKHYETKMLTVKTFFEGIPEKWDIICLMNII